MIYKLTNGDCVHRYHKSIIVAFNGKRKVLSTSPFNGGYREGLDAVFNNDGNPGAGIACQLRAPTYVEHMRIITSELGLDPDKTAGISTAASMDNVAIKVETFEELTVTAIVTGGVEVNGGRVGDPASYHERNGKPEMVKQGTINIILNIDANLPEGAIVRALVTCTEAKTAALQELMAGSNYSRGLATGSGTDGTILISNAESEINLTNAGKHSKLGELIGCAVKAAVKEALYLQTKLCPENQHSILKRGKRYGITEEKIWEMWLKKGDTPVMSIIKEHPFRKADFIDRLHRIDRDGMLVTLTSLYLHLLDQLEWGLLSGSEVVEEAKWIITRIKDQMGLTVSWTEVSDRSNDELIDGLTDNFKAWMAEVGGKDNV